MNHQINLSSLLPYSQRDDRRTTEDQPVREVQDRGCAQASLDRSKWRGNCDPSLNYQTKRTLL